MKISINRKRLISALKLVAAFTKPNKALPILENVCFFRLPGTQKIRLSTTNLQSVALAEIEYDSIELWEIEEVKGVVVPCGTLLKTLEKMPQEDESILVYTETEEGKTHFENTVGTRKFSFNTIYNEMLFKDEEVSFTVYAGTTSDVWRNLLSKALPIVSTDDLKPAMTGVLLQSESNGSGQILRSVATDAHALCVNHESLLNYIGNMNFSTIVHSEGIQAILPHLNGAGVVTFSQSANKQSFKFRSSEGIDTEILLSKIDAKFPEFGNVIPKTKEAKCVFVCNRKQLIDSIKRASLYTDSTTWLGRFDIDTDTDVLLIQSSDINDQHYCKETVKMHTKYNIEENRSLVIGLNIKLLLRVLNLLDCEEVCLYYYAANRAILIEDENNAFNEYPIHELVLQQRFILMPVLLNY